MVAASTKKKRVSKKSKLSWRKHVDIQDVEDFLEEKRLEERLGKPVSEKTDSELFQLDTNPTPVSQLETTKDARRVKLRQRLPRSHITLQPHTQVPDPLIKRNRVRTKEERKNELVRRKEQNLLKQGIFKARELQSLRDSKLYNIRRANKSKSPEFLADVWNEKDDTELHTNPWIDNETKLHTLKGTGKIPKPAPKSVIRKHSCLPAVEAPHPGISYNPTYNDHQVLLQNAVEKEKKIIKVEKHLMRVTTGMFRKVTSTQRDGNWLVEMSEGLLHASGKNEEHSEDENTDYKSVNPPVQNKKKTLKQRRVQREQKKLQHDRLLTKTEKKKVADIYKLRFINKHLEKLGKKSETVQEKRQKKKDNKGKEVKQLSSLKFEEEEIYFNKPEDISGTLRNIKKEGSLLLSRYKSLQKRNILQPTTKRIHKKGKIKRFKKVGHKEDWKTTVARARR